MLFVPLISGTVVVDRIELEYYEIYNSMTIINENKRYNLVILNRMWYKFSYLSAVEIWIEVIAPGWLIRSVILDIDYK